jgi:ABC-2 type transport system ATP-binding protein
LWTRIPFEIKPGEVVFLVPNGVEKTTNLKMLDGLMYPTAGQLQVLGVDPARRSKDLLRFPLVTGNCNQLAWDLPTLDSFELQRVVYGIPGKEFKCTRNVFITLLELQELVHIPVRYLILGEQMKMEIVDLLLHRPKVFFLGELTTG